MAKAKFVEFSLGGDTVHYGDGCTGSGYGSPERPHAADPRTHEIPDGTLVLDKRPALGTAAGKHWVFKGPMVNVDLEEGEVDRLPEGGIIAQAMMGDRSNQFGQMLRAQKAHKEKTSQPGPLDYVSVSEYVAGWVAKGAIVGTYENGNIKWER